MPVETQDRYWTDKKEWQEFGRQESQKRANLTVRNSLDEKLRFLHVEDREIEIRKSFERRMKDLEQSRLLFVKEGPGGLEYKVGRQKNRFMHHNKAVRRRFQRLFARQFAQGVFLTLTTWPKKYFTREAALSRIWSDFHKFKKQLDERHRDKMPVEMRKFYKPMQYIACLEFTREGWPHLHVCFVGIPYLAPKNYLKHLWYQYHESYIVSVTGYRAVSIYAYILKYLGKLQDMPVSLQALMWYGRKRFYNLSRHFLNELPEQVKKGYRFIACVKSEFEKELPDIFKVFRWTGATFDNAEESLISILDTG